MKIGVFSDTHHDMSRVRQVILKFKEEKVDAVFHLGDKMNDVLKVEEELKVPLFSVPGNCDFIMPGDKTYKKVSIFGKNFYLTHGHMEDVVYNSNVLVQRAKEFECDCACFGHTHTPYNNLEDSVLVFNPGSPTEPRGKSRNSYGILTVEEGKIHGEIKFL